MAIPISADLSTLDFVDWSLPTLSVISTKQSAGEALLGLDYVDWTLPIIGAGAPSSASGAFQYANISGTWKNVASVHVNISGTWKTVSLIKSNISSSWKTSG